MRQFAIATYVSAMQVSPLAPAGQSHSSSLPFTEQVPYTQYSLPTHVTSSQDVSVLPVNAWNQKF